MSTSALKRIIQLGTCIVAALCFSPASALTPLEEFESDAVLGAAKAEIKAFSPDQIEATILYLTECGPLPGSDRDVRCERASTALTIKTHRAGAFHRLRLAIFVLDKVSPWNRANRTRADAALFERRVMVFADLGEAAAERYDAIARQPR